MDIPIRHVYLPDVETFSNYEAASPLNSPQLLLDEGGFRNSESNDVNDQYNEYDDDSDRSGDEDLESGIHTLRPHRRKGWNLLRRHLQDGNLLLKAKNLSDSPKRSRMSLRQAIVDEIQDGMSFSTRFCLFAIGLYLAVSIAMYTFVLEPEWTVIDSCYFAVTTFTTLGYGDLAPTNVGSIIFTCIFALTGVAFLGMVLGVLGQRLIEKHDVMKEKCEAATQKEVMTMFGRRRLSSPLDASMLSIDAWLSLPTTTTAGSERTFVSAVREKIWGGGAWNWRHFSIMVVVVFLLVCVIARGSGWGVVSTIYFVIVTSCTIGYGDLVPSTQIERLVAIVYIPLVCLIMGHWLAYVARSIIEIQSSQFRKSRFGKRELTQDDLDAMDDDGDGKVSRAEFLQFMLVAMEKVDYELLDDLKCYFENLDVAHTGELSKDDLVEGARRKLKCARRKLELARYKRKLINQGKFTRRRRPVRKVLANVHSFIHESCRHFTDTFSHEGDDQNQETKFGRQINRDVSTLRMTGDALRHSDRSAMRRQSEPGFRSDSGDKTEMRWLLGGDLKAIDEISNTDSRITDENKNTAEEVEQDGGNDSRSRTCLHSSERWATPPALPSTHPTPRMSNKKFGIRLGKDSRLEKTLNARKTSSKTMAKRATGTVVRAATKSASLIKHGVYGAIGTLDRGGATRWTGAGEKHENIDSDLPNA